MENIPADEFENSPDEYQTETEPSTEEVEAFVDWCVEWFDAECAQMASESASKLAAEREEYVSKLPRKIKMLRLHGFIDENGRRREWLGGDVITDIHEITLLADRKAEFEAI